MVVKVGGRSSSKEDQTGGSLWRGGAHTTGVGVGHEGRGGSSR